MRLVSLLPSATEIVYALGLGDQLVGVTLECDEPASARAEKTVVVGGLDTRGMTPREIDDYVRGQLAADGNLYTLHERALADLEPDLILTQDLCRACALPSGQVEAALGYRRRRRNRRPPGPPAGHRRRGARGNAAPRRRRARPAWHDSAGRLKPGLAAPA
jgi:hypothetical protein